MALIKLNNQSLTAVTSAGLPSGSVLQVIQFLDEGADESSKSHLASLVAADGYTDIMTKTITTTLENSKILVGVNVVAYNGTNVLRGRAKLLRGSTEINNDRYAFYTSGGDIFIPFSSTVLDLPNVAASTTLTYKFQVSNNTGGDLIIGYGDVNGGVSSALTLTEIAG